MSVLNRQTLAIFFIVFLVLALLIIPLGRAHALDARIFLDLLLKAGIIPLEKEAAARALLDEEEKRGSTVIQSPVPFSVVCPFTWTRDLREGESGDDVKKLQQFLNIEQNTRLAQNGPGAPGQETSFFGPLTLQALVKFQEKHAAEALTPYGAVLGTGYFGAETRKKMNKLCGGGTEVAKTNIETETKISEDKTTEEATIIKPASRATTPPELAIKRIDTLGEFISVPHDVKEVDFGTFEFKAGGGGTIVSGISIERFGTGEETTDIAHVWIVVDGVQKGNPKDFSKNIAFIGLGGDLIEIPPYWVSKVTIKGVLSQNAKVGSFNTLGISEIDTGVPIVTPLPIKGPLITISSKTSQ